MKEKTPLFPLNLVMYPEAVYPLHIFEERYKRMINRCTKFSETFVIIAKIDLEMSEIGCRVKVLSILTKYENGSMDILIQGVERVKVLSTVLHKEGYLEAAVENYNDLSSNIFNPSTLGETILKFREIIDITQIELNEKFWKNLEGTSSKSFKIAEKSGLNLKQQQKLLSLQSENERIDFLNNHLGELKTSLEKNDTLRKLIAGDGYIN
ncbi:MAG: LON peptidase substrate-binding domain-containing protein [Melioribacteraceae bacterium]|nr:LON peptidase substrate-binding domain-containing protein [Melioribacteraceae bacterium]